MILTASRLPQVAFMHVCYRQPQASDMVTRLHCHGAKFNHHKCKQKLSQGLQDASPKRKPQPIHAYQTYQGLVSGDWVGKEEAPLW